MSKLGEEQRLLEQRETEMRDMIAKAEEKRSWFSAFREWMESVATFLDEKVRLTPVPLLALHPTPNAYYGTTVSTTREAGRGAHLAHERTCRDDRPEATRRRHR